MNKKSVVFIFLMLVIFGVTVFAGDLHYTLGEWFNEKAGDDPDVNGCTWAPDGIYYNGRYISFRAVCDAHDRDYNNKVERELADSKLRDGIYDTLRRNGVPLLQARAIADLYYAGVRTFGWMFY